MHDMDRDSFLTFLETSFCGTGVWIGSCWVWRRPSDGNGHQQPQPRPPPHRRNYPVRLSPSIFILRACCVVRPTSGSHSIKDKVAFSDEKVQYCSNIFLPLSPRCLFLTSTVTFAFCDLKVCWRDWYTSYRNVNLSPFGENHHFESKTCSFVAFVLCEQLFLVFLVSPSSSEIWSLVTWIWTCNLC